MDNLVPVLLQSTRIENDTNLALSWDDLGQMDRKIVIAMVYEGTPEEARRKLGMSHSTFYRKWSQLKGYYNDLLKDFPKKASEILVSQSIQAAKVLSEQLESSDERIRQHAATQILDRSLPKELVKDGLTRKITLEEFSRQEFGD